MKFKSPQYSERSNLELTIIAFIIFIFITLVIIKVIPMFGKFEKNRFEATLRNIELIINIHASTQIMKGKSDQLLALVDGNPFSLIKEKHLPATYIGELDDPNHANINGYQWYFDRSDHTLVYRIENKGYFPPSESESTHVKFKLILKYTDKNANSVFDKRIDEIRGLLLKPQIEYKWLS